MSNVNNEYLKDHKLFRVRNKRIIALFPFIAVMVVLMVFWCLKLVGITVTSDALCELDEHTHISSCYSGDTLVCFKPEHTHSAECFPNRSVDLETANDWTKTLERVSITNDLAKNLVSVASTQVGYKESALNYEFNEFAEKNHYTRYGEWYGNPYGKWNTLFVAFCLNYSNINGSDALEKSTADAMLGAWDSKKLYFSADEYNGSIGDVVFFDTNADNRADRTGIVAYSTDTMLIAIEGDVDGVVEKVVYREKDTVLGYGKTSGLYAEKHITQTDNKPTEAPIKTSELSGRLNKYIPNAVQASTYSLRRGADSRSATIRSVFDSEPLAVMNDDGHSITYTSHLEGEVVNAVFKETTGTVIGPGGTVYVGQTYVVSLEFSEINTGTEWVQFRHEEDGYLTYHIPENLECERFDNWHIISAKTENGTVQDVGEYFVDENGLLRVRFFEDADGENFVDKYSNVDFTIDFSATVAATQSGESTDVKFNDKININLNVDGGAEIATSKTHSAYDAQTNTMEYTIRVEAIHGVVKNFTIDDQIYEHHYTLRDTIVVTDLDGNVLDPQPVISDNPDIYAVGGFLLSGFPDFEAGEGFLIKYKTSIYDYMLGDDTVGVWNGVNAIGQGSNGSEVKNWVTDWDSIELDKLNKDGKQVVLTDYNGNEVRAVEWQIEIRKSASNIQGTVIVDTLGEGLAYYTGQSIRVKRYDEWGYPMADAYISWNDVTVNGNTMSFPLPDCHSCVIVYYTTYEELDEGEIKNYTNSAKVTINGKEEQVNGSADVVGFVPKVRKSASGTDGEYVYFKIEADVPGVIKDWGNFFLTDFAGIWGYNTDGSTLYIENMPQDIVITATTASGQVVIFTPYVAGGTVENTYKLIYPAEGNQAHSFNILFNTADDTKASSKWIFAEDSVLTINYKIPFDTKTGNEWTGELTGDKTLEDVFLEGKKLSNEAYLNYTDIISGTGTADYEYSPIISKKADTHDDGTIDYTVIFNNTIPGSGGGEGYLNGTVANAYFTDTFDEKLEYVPGTMVLTAYSPYQSNLWTGKYQYNGTITGNSINVSLADFMFVGYNTDSPDWSWITNTGNFRNYFHWVNAGGRYVVTYKLKLKDEYLKTTEHARFHLDNTAELTWSPDGTSGPVTETTEYETGLIDKQVVQEDTKLLFQVHINRSALDILPGADTLTIEDTMTGNLSVYWDTIKLKYLTANGEWIDFDAPESQHTYTITYDPALNMLTFVVPDSLHVIIDYTTLITESGFVSINNAVRVDGKAEVSDVIDAIFRVEEHSGGASGSNNDITLIKQDGITNVPLPNATFVLYGLVGDPFAVVPQGIAQSIVAEDGQRLRYIGQYTTGPDGTVHIENQYLTVGGPYALVEVTPPAGYEKLTEPTYFFFYKDDPEGNIQSVTTLIAIENINGSFLIPETGGTIFYTAIIGFAATAAPILYSLIRRKRERRLKNLLG
ncbi:MAG: hypothetical protein IKT61_03455 [Clostridia bacterium]|nr:hypothetical protein [Clostridia bacterium]